MLSYFSSHDDRCVTHSLQGSKDLKPHSTGVSCVFLIITNCNNAVTVGTSLTGCPPYSSVRAELPHTAPTSSIWRQNEHSDMDGPDAGVATSGIEAGKTVPTSSGPLPYGCADELPTAKVYRLGYKTRAMLSCYRGLHNNL